MTDPVCPVQGFTGTRIISPRHEVGSILRTVKESKMLERKNKLRRLHVRLLLTYMHHWVCLHYARVRRHLAG